MKVVGALQLKKIYDCAQGLKRGLESFYFANVHTLLSYLMEFKITVRNLRERTEHREKSLFHKTRLGLLVIEFLFSLNDIAFGEMKTQRPVYQMCQVGLQRHN